MSRHQHTLFGQFRDMLDASAQELRPVAPNSLAPRETKTPSVFKHRTFVSNSFGWKAGASKGSKHPLKRGRKHVHFAASRESTLLYILPESPSCPNVDRSLLTYVLPMTCAYSRSLTGEWQRRQRHWQRRGKFLQWPQEKYCPTLQPYQGKQERAGSATREGRVLQ